MSGINRTEILRRDCTQCGGNSYITVNGVQEACPLCEGSGMLEKEVPFKFEGPRTDSELAEIWGVSVDEVPTLDTGHDTPRSGGVGE